MRHQLLVKLLVLGLTELALLSSQVLVLVPVWDSLLDQVLVRDRHPDLAPEWDQVLVRDHRLDLAPEWDLA